MNQEQIGKWIALLRKEKRMTQEQLAERLGVSNRSVSRWENGRCMPDFSLLWDIADELDVSVSELLNGKRAEGDMGSPDGIDTFLAWAGREKQQKAKRLGLYFRAGMACLLLALLQTQFGVVSFLLPKGQKGLLTLILATVGVMMNLFGFACNRQNALLTQKEIKLLSKDGGIVMMKNAQEMLRFAQKYRAVERKCYKSAFAEVEKCLEEGESAVFAATGEGYYRNELPMMWHAVLAVTEKRLLIGGDRMKGMIMIRYNVESFPLKDVTRVEQVGAVVVIQAGGMELKIEEGDYDAASEIAQGLMKAIGIKG